MGAFGGEHRGEAISSNGSDAEGSGEEDDDKTTGERPHVFVRKSPAVREGEEFLCAHRDLWMTQIRALAKEKVVYMS